VHDPALGSRAEEERDTKNFEGVKPMKLSIVKHLFAGVVLLGTLVVPAAIAIPSVADACGGFATLQTFTIYDSSGHVAATGELDQDTCTQGLRTVVHDPWWFSYAMACVVDQSGPDSAAYATITPICTPNYWKPFGGDVELPEIKCIPGHYYYAQGYQNSNYADTFWSRRPFC
jgi:hypothetical protein